MVHPKPTPYLRAVVGIIKDHGKILVSERPLHKPYGGYWEFPGGKIEANERPMDALKRELKEELGIEVIRCKPWFEHIHQYPDKTVLLDVWLIEEFVGAVQPNEGQNLKWVTFKEISTLNLLEGNIPLLDKIQDLLLQL